MEKKLLVFLSFFVFLAYPAFVLAEDTSTTANTTTTTQASDATETPTTTNTRLLKKPVATLREEVKEARGEVRDAMKDKMAQAREEFKTKLSAIKDEKKQQIVTNLDSRISTINKNRTTEMSERLDRLTNILGKISTKEATLKSEGKNTVKLAADIVAAQAAIDAAKQAVTDQAAKVYTMNITTDTALKSAAATTIQQFMTDIKAVRTKVLAAQQAVVKAYKEVGQLMGVTPTLTPAVTTTTAPTP